MKLLFCTSCQDVIKLHEGVTRSCLCGKVSGKYLNMLDAVYSGETAVPMGFANNSLLLALRNQPMVGLGETFKAFVIPKECDTFKKVDNINKF